MPLPTAHFFSKRSGDFLDLVRLQQVAFLDVVISGQLHTAFQALADLAGVVLLALQRFEGVVADNAAVADQRTGRRAG